MSNREKIIITRGPVVRSCNAYLVPGINLNNFVHPVKGRCKILKSKSLVTLPNIANSSFVYDIIELYYHSQKH